MQAVGAVPELHGEVVVGGAVGVQGARHLPAADEAVLPAQHDDWTVDELHDELLRLAWTQDGRLRPQLRLGLVSKILWHTNNQKYKMTLFKPPSLLIYLYSLGDLTWACSDARKANILGGTEGLALLWKQSFNNRRFIFFKPMK